MSIREKCLIFVEIVALVSAATVSHDPRSSSGKCEKGALAALMLVLLAGCSSSMVYRSAVLQDTARPVGAVVKCPAQDFDAFLLAYSGDVEVQKTFTKVPLQSDSVDALAEPEPKTVSRMLTKAELSFPLIPSLQQQAHDGLKLSQSAAGGEREVRLSKDGTDYQMSFFFREEYCWMLYRVRDDSL